MSHDEQILATLHRMLETQQEALALQKQALENQQLAITNQKIAVKHQLATGRIYRIAITVLAVFLIACVYFLARGWQ